MSSAHITAVHFTLFSPPVCTAQNSPHNPWPHHAPLLAWPHNSTPCLYPPHAPLLSCIFSPPASITTTPPPPLAPHSPLLSCIELGGWLYQLGGHHTEDWASTQHSNLQGAQHTPDCCTHPQSCHRQIPAPYSTGSKLPHCCTQVSDIRRLCSVYHTRPGNTCSYPVQYLLKVCWCDYEVDAV